MFVVLLSLVVVVLTNCPARMGCVHVCACVHVFFVVFFLRGGGGGGRDRIRKWVEGGEGECCEDLLSGLHSTAKFQHLVNHIDNSIHHLILTSVGFHFWRLA